jgi:hypothetical protein
VAQSVFAGKQGLRASSNDYDWLGDGIYFWEHNAQRAFDFAREMSRRPHPSGQKIRKPAVVGAIIDLGYCLNLLDSHFIEMVKTAHANLLASFEAAEIQLPQNTGGRDRVNRKLDCAVIRSIHQSRKQHDQPSFDTVRAAFVEGEPLYDNAGFAARSHIQICVRNPRCIKGYFRPLDDAGRPIKFK